MLLSLALLDLDLDKPTGLQLFESRSVAHAVHAHDGRLLSADWQLRASGADWPNEDGVLLAQRNHCYPGVEGGDGGRAEMEEREEAESHASRCQNRRY